MDFKFYCIHCGQHISASEQDQGVVGACPSCGGTFTVPSIADGQSPEPVAPVQSAPLMPRPTVRSAIPPKATVRAAPSSVMLPRAPKPPPRSGNSLPAPHHVGPARSGAVDTLVATEAARAKRAGYWIIGCVCGVIGIGALFIMLPSQPLVPVAATDTPKNLSAPAVDLPPPATVAVAGVVAGAVATATAPPTPAAPASAPTPTAPAEAPKDAAPAPEMKAQDADAKEKKADAESTEADQILGGLRRSVDELMSGAWTIRESAKRVLGTETVYYDGEVSMMVQFRAGRAVSVNVAAPTTPTPKPIGPEQYRSLLRLIGQAPKDSDIKKDATGILEFIVGEK